jgi:hypothetical protein
MSVRVALGIAPTLVFVLFAGCGRVGYDLSTGAAQKSVRDRDAADGVPTDSGAGDAHVGTGGAGSTVGGEGGVSVGSGGRSGDGGTTSAAGGTDARVPLDAGRHDGGGFTPDGGRTDGATGCALVPQALADWCTELPELPAPPVIDGELECGLEARAVVPAAYNLSGTPDATMDYAVAWTDGGLYVYASVHDPAVLPAPSADPSWQGDSLEIYVDSDGVYGAPPAYDPATRQIVVAAPLGAATSTRAETYAVPPTGVAWTSTQFAACVKPYGYVVEAFVTASDLGLSSWPLAAGSSVGFDLGLNVSGATADAGTQGTRIGQYFLRADATPTGHPFQSVTAFCNPVLVSR